MDKEMSLLVEELDLIDQLLLSNDESSSKPFWESHDAASERIKGSQNLQRFNSGQSSKVAVPANPEGVAVFVKSADNSSSNQWNVLGYNLDVFVSSAPTRIIIRSARRGTGVDSPPTEENVADKGVLLILDVKPRSRIWGTGHGKQAYIYYYDSTDKCYMMFLYFPDQKLADAFHAALARGSQSLLIDNTDGLRASCSSTK